MGHWTDRKASDRSGRVFLYLLTTQKPATATAARAMMRRTAYELSAGAWGVIVYKLRRAGVGRLESLDSAKPTLRFC